MVVLDPLDLLNPLDHLVAVHGVRTQTERATVHIRQGLVVHAPRQDSLIFHCHGDVQALVVGFGRAAVVGVAHVAEGGHHNVACLVGLLDQCENVAQAHALPLGDAGPTLHAGVHGDVDFLAQLLELVNAQGLGFLHQAAQLEAVVNELVLLQAVPLGALTLCRRASVNPVEGRNVGIGEGLLLHLTGGDAVQQDVTNRLGQTPNEGLSESQVAQGPVGCENPQSHGEDNAANEHGDCLSELCCVDLVVGLVQHHVGDVVLGVNHEHQRHVNDGEDAVERHAQEVDGTRGLAVTEEAHVAGETAAECRAHNRAGCNHQRCHDEHHGEVHDLLQSVVRLEMLNRGNLEASVNLDGFPRLRDDVPAGRDDAAPLTGQEQQGDIYQTVNNPDDGHQRVPCAAQTNLGFTGQRNQGRQGALVIARSKCAGGGRDLVLGELNPLRTRGAVVVPVQAGVRGENFPT